MCVCTLAEIKRDTGFYPDTPLSVNHALMKDQPLRPAASQPAALPVINYFGNSLGKEGNKEMGTLKTMGITKVNPPVDTKPPPLF